MAGYNRFQKILMHQMTSKPKGETYTGEWHGQTVTFDRMFRTHRFTDVECARLCNGNTLQVYNLERNGVYYAVEGKLDSDDLKIGDKVLTKVIFRKIRDIINDPELNEVSEKSAESEVARLSAEAALLQDFDMPKNSLQADLNAQMNAILSVPMIPPIRQVRAGTPDQLPKYEPVLGFDEYFRTEETDSRCESVDEDQSYYDEDEAVDSDTNEDEDDETYIPEEEPGFEDAAEEFDSEFEAEQEPVMESEPESEPEDVEPATPVQEVVPDESVDYSHYYDELYSDHSTDDDDFYEASDLLDEYTEGADDESIEDDSDSEE